MGWVGGVFLWFRVFGGGGLFFCGWLVVWVVG